MMLRMLSAPADANLASIVRKSRNALAGIDVNKLDTIALSKESVQIVEVMQCLGRGRGGKGGGG